MKTSEFINQESQKQYEEDGYAIIKNVLNAAQIEQLKKLFDIHYYHNKPHTIWNSICDTPYEKAPILSRQILDVVKPNLDKIFKNYVCPLGTFLVINPSPTSTVRLHRDFSIQDETEFAFKKLHPSHQVV